ncbi:MAG: V-type ATP synthase subunit F [Planctomycetota bacterium]|jgi:V/A-type H+-transporting ATPase subunit F
MEGKAAVLGSADFVMPFAALGLDTFPTESDAERVQETAASVLKQKYALVVVAENIARSAQEIFEEKAQAATPCVIVVPFTTEPEGVATESLGRMLRLATGINILET